MLLLHSTLTSSSGSPHPLPPLCSSWLTLWLLLPLLRWSLWAGLQLLELGPGLGTELGLWQELG